LDKNEFSMKSVVPTVNIPGSKSLSQRALVAAALARNHSRITNVLVSEDTRYLIGGLRALGADIESSREGFAVAGTGGRIINSGIELFLGNNGTALRFLTALVCLGHGNYVLTGEKRLCERPVGPLVEALRKMGADITTHQGCPPVEIKANGLSGGKIVLRDIQSSQYVSALLLCAPYMSQGIDLSVAGSIVSVPYIDLTIAVMKDFGAVVTQTGKRDYHVEGGTLYRGCEYHVEGDASSASYFFLAAALLKKTIRVKGINRQSTQGDIRILDIFEAMGCLVKSGEDWIEVTGGVLKKGDMLFHLNDMPDMVPTLAILAAFREGETAITDVAHLRIKESDRLRAVVTELNRTGIEARELPDGLVIQGGKMRPANVETYNDHRLAMSFAVAGLVVRGLEVMDKRCVDKSFPNFWEELRVL